MIKTEKICKSFKNGKLETQVLFDIGLEIARGEFVAIMGASGCGKSTLMHLLGLMLTPTSGQIQLAGQEVAALSEAQRATIRREKIGFVFQRFNLLPTVSARQNLTIAERIRGRALDGQIDKALAAVEMLEKADHKPNQLSIGQQQRIAIARAICHEPQIVLADEPTGCLDSRNATRILEILRQIHQRQRVTIVMITHSLESARWADRIITMADGRIQLRSEAQAEAGPENILKIHA